MQLNAHLWHGWGCSCCILDYAWIFKFFGSSGLLVWNSYFIKTLLSIKKCIKIQTVKLPPNIKKQREGINSPAIRKGGTDGLVDLKKIEMDCNFWFWKFVCSILWASCLGDRKQVQDHDLTVIWQGLKRESFYWLMKTIAHHKGFQWKWNQMRHVEKVYSTSIDSDTELQTWAESKLNA